MADADLYDTDILAWSEQQAAVLRSLAGRRDLPNDLDLSHVVEEIEDVGLSQLNAAKSFIRLVLAHAIKCWADPNAPAVPHWHEEIAVWQDDLSDRLTASMRHKIDLDVLWRQAVKQAAISLRARGNTSPATVVSLVALGTVCPLDLNDLSAEPSDLVVKLAAALHTP